MSKLSENITKAVMKDLRGRKGILDDVEPDIQREMEEELEFKIQNEIDKVVEGK